jgi:hypothetical protein
MVTLRGAASLFSTAHRLSDVHVRMGAGRETCVGGWFRTTGAGGAGAAEAIGGFTGATAGATFRTGIGGFSGVNDHSCGGGSLGCVAHPAKNSSAAQKTINGNLNTRPF